MDINQQQKILTLKWILLAVGLFVSVVAYIWIKATVDPREYLRISMSLLMLNIATTFYMTGLIWVVQIVNYPLFAKIGADQFDAYHKSHVWRITAVVAVPMLIETVTALMMLWYPFPGIPFYFIVLGLCLIFVIWLSTLFLQVPQHDALLKKWDHTAQKKLTLTNWIRTLAWTLRAMLIFGMMCHVIK